MQAPQFSDDARRIFRDFDGLAGVVAPRIPRFIALSGKDTSNTGLARFLRSADLRPSYVERLAGVLAHGAFANLEDLA